MSIDKFATAKWAGGLKKGTGTLSTESKCLDAQPYGFQSRFEGDRGTNPEELIGAALAGCYSMALAAAFEKAGHIADDIETTAQVTLSKVEQGFEVTDIALKVSVRCEGFDDARILALATDTKKTCPISQLLRAKIALSSTRT